MEWQHSSFCAHISGTNCQRTAGLLHQFLNQTEDFSISLCLLLNQIFTLFLHSVFIFILAFLLFQFSFMLISFFLFYVSPFQFLCKYFFCMILCFFYIVLSCLLYVLCKALYLYAIQVSLPCLALPHCLNSLNFSRF